jgi:hypothetical protein
VSAKVAQEAPANRPAPNAPERNSW